MQAVLSWTGGQPFLTQKVCRLLLLEAGENEQNPSILVEKLVLLRIIDNWEAQDEPEHLKTIRDRILLGHLAALNTRQNRSERKAQKLALVRRLYEKGFDEQFIINLLAFIDWMLTLPPDIEAEFKLEVKQLEAGRRMKYVTSFERSARQEQALSMVTQLLNRRDGDVDEANARAYAFKIC